MIRPIHPTEDSALDEIIADYLEAKERGRAPSRALLLQAHPSHVDELEAFLDDEHRFDAVMTPFAREATPVGAADDPRDVPRFVGRYEILGVIARGGMGIVYKARQTTGRHVALKMIRGADQATSEESRRFQLEAAAVAGLDHPGIVPLYDVGEDRGRAYFVMKLVEGGNLAEHHDRFRGRPKKIAELMLAVTRAVEHAHQRGILHRDLKPGNVLLDEQGRPMVTDFGLAKRLVDPCPEGAAPEPSGALTQSGILVGTPAYVAPEQARGNKALTIAADVYGLGAILYETLTGRPPFGGLTHFDTLLDVVDKAPTPPRSLDASIDRDLETICLKCLEKQPQQRYTTTTALAEDLQCYLNGEPILARPLGPLQRLGRWCRRQPLVASLVGAVLASVIAGVTLVLLQWQRAEANLDEANRQRHIAEQKQAEAERQKIHANRQTGIAKAKTAEVLRQETETEAQRRRADKRQRQAHQAVLEFCIRLSKYQLSDVEGLQPLQKELVEAGLTYLQAFVKDNENDAELRRDLADAWFSLGIATNVIDSKVKALEAYEKARTAYSQLLRDNPNDEYARDRLAGTWLNLSNVHKALGAYGKAVSCLQESQVIWRKLLVKRPESRTYRGSLASTFTNEAGLRGILGDGEEANRLFFKARDVYLELYKEEANDLQVVEGLATAQHNAAIAFMSQRKNAEALKTFKETLALKERLVKEMPRGLWHKRRLAKTHHSIADCYRKLGDDKMGFEHYDKALKILRPLVQANPDVTDFRGDLAAALQNQGIVFVDVNQPGKGLGAYNEAIGHLKQLVKDNPRAQLFRLQLAQTYHNVGNLLREHNENKQAVDAFRHGLENFEILATTSPERVRYHHFAAGTANNLADALQRMNQNDEAVEHFEKAIRSQELVRAKQPRNERALVDSITYYGNLARAHRLAKQPEKAIAVSLKRRDLAKNHPRLLVDVVKDFMLAADLVQREAQRERCLDHALEALKMAIKAGHPDVAALKMLPEIERLRKHREVDRLLRR